MYLGAYVITNICFRKYISKVKLQNVREKMIATTRTGIFSIFSRLRTNSEGGNSRETQKNSAII